MCYVLYKYWKKKLVLNSVKISLFLYIQGDSWYKACWYFNMFLNTECQMYYQEICVWSRILPKKFSFIQIFSLQFIGRGGIYYWLQMISHIKGTPENNERFTEDHALSRLMIWLLPHSPPPSPGSKLDRRFKEDWGRETTGWWERGEGMGEEPNHTTASKPGPL